MLCTCLLEPSTGTGRCGARFWWPTGTTMGRSCFVPGGWIWAAECEVLGARSSRCCSGRLCNDLSLLQRRQSTVGKMEELPREMSGSISWTNSMLLEIQMETCIPGKCLPLLLALISHRHCVGERDGWGDLPFLGTSWPLLLVPQGPSPRVQLAPPLPHIAGSHNSPWPQPAPLLLQSLLPWGAVLCTLSLNTIMLQWVFFLPLWLNWRFFVIFFDHLKVIFCFQSSSL